MKCHPCSRFYEQTKQTLNQHFKINQALTVYENLTFSLLFHMFDMYSVFSICNESMTVFLCYARFC